MPDDILIEWALGERGSPDAAEVRIQADGWVTLSARLGGGKYRLPSDDLEALRQFIEVEQRFGAVQQNELEAGVEAAAARQKRVAPPGAEFHAGAQADAKTTTLRVSVRGRTQEITYHDLLGDAERYPDVEELQRLRAIELRLLRLAEELRQKQR